MKQEVLGHAESRYRALFENAIVGAFQTGVDGRIIWVNRAAAQIIGYDSPEEFQTHVSNIEEIYVEPRRREDFVAQALHREVRDFEYRIRRRDGQIRWISVTARSVDATDGRPAAFEGIVIDVTQRKLVEAAIEAVASEREPGPALTSFAEVLRKVVPFAQLSFVVIEGDSYRRVVSVGKTQSFVAGALVPLEGNSVKDAVETGHPVVISDTDEGRFPFDLWLRKAGVRSYVVLPLAQNGRVFGAFNVGFAEPRVTTAETVALLSALSSAVAQGVGNIVAFEQQREAIERLEEIGALKSAFLSSVSHNLRTPLTAIVGAALTLERRRSELPEDEAAEMLTYLVDNARKLEKMVDDLLDLDRLSQKTVEPSRRHVDVAQLVKRVVDATRSIERRVEIDAQPMVASMDVPKLERILESLVMNAMRHTPDDAHVWVRLSARAHDVLLVVEDDGPGVPDHLKHAIFEPFRAGSGSEHAPGTGIGLALVRRLAELHGGRAWVEDREGGGASFRVLLPRVAERTS